MNFFLRVEDGEMNRAINLYSGLLGIYYMGDDKGEIDMWLNEYRGIPIFLPFLRYVPDNPNNNPIISDPSGYGVEYILTSLKTVMQALVRYPRPFTLFFTKDEYISLEEYYLRVGDLFACLYGEDDITCFVEARTINELISLKIRGAQNFLISVIMIDFLKN